MVRILIADDHAVVRDGLRLTLEKAGLQVVGECATGREAIALARTTRPDIVIMDISMPDLNGIDATRQLLRELPDVKVLALSMHLDRRYVSAMFEAGASGYLIKNSASGDVLSAVEALAQNRRYVSPSVAGTIVEGLRRAAPSRGATELSLREREVLQLLAEGHTSKEIGARLFIAIPTVETHRRQIMDKLGLRTIAELTKFAIREGITALEK